jgi:hypothetical protein
MKTRLIVYCVVWFLLSFGFLFGVFMSSGDPLPAIAYPFMLLILIVQTGILVWLLAGLIEFVLWIIRKANS